MEKDSNNYQKEYVDKNSEPPENKDTFLNKIKTILLDKRNWEKVEPLPSQVLWLYYLLGIVAMGMSLYIIFYQ